MQSRNAAKQIARSIFCKTFVGVSEALLFVDPCNVLQTASLPMKPPGKEGFKRCKALMGGFTHFDPPTSCHLDFIDKRDASLVLILIRFRMALGMFSDPV